MNELELLRGQLTLEREHALAAGRACAAALARERASHGPGRAADLIEAAIGYIAGSLAAFDERDQRLAEIVRLRFPPGSAEARGLTAALSGPGSGREVLTALEAAAASTRAGRVDPESPALWRAFEDALLGAWCERRAALDGLLGRLALIADWRSVAGLDADAILAERARFDALRRLLPAGIELTGAAPERQGQ